MGPQSAGAALLSRGFQLTFGATANIAVAGIISGASGAGFVKQGDPIAVREMSTNAAALSPRKLRFDSPFSRASFSSPAGALASSGGGNAQKRGRTSIPSRRRSNIYLVFKVFW